MLDAGVFDDSGLSSDALIGTTVTGFNAGAVTGTARGFAIGAVTGLTSVSTAPSEFCLIKISSLFLTSLIGAFVCLPCFALSF